MDEDIFGVLDRLHGQPVPAANHVHPRLGYRDELGLIQHNIRSQPFEDATNAYEYVDMRGPNNSLDHEPYKLDAFGRSSSTIIIA